MSQTIYTCDAYKRIGDKMVHYKYPYAYTYIEVVRLGSKKLEKIDLESLPWKEQINENGITPFERLLKVGDMAAYSTNSCFGHHFFVRRMIETGKIEGIERYLFERWMKTGE